MSIPLFFSNIPQSFQTKLTPGASERFDTGVARVLSRAPGIHEQGNLRRISERC